MQRWLCVGFSVLQNVPLRSQGSHTVSVAWGQQVWLGLAGFGWVALRLVSWGSLES